MTDPTRVSTNHIATVLGISWAKAARLLSRIPMYPPDRNGLYDSRVLDLVRAMRGQDHRALEPVDNDWLARYVEENSGRTRTTQPGPGGRP